MDNLKRDLRDTIIMIILFLALLYALPLDANHPKKYEVWWKHKGDRYFQPCIEIADSLGPVEKHIPSDLIIVVRDNRDWSLTVLTRGR